jgi:serine/threonine protein kinase/tetratricopeptide (TPR) repeat protein
MSPAEAVFFAAAEKPIAERAAYLAEACAGDADLRQRVERMLAARPHVDRFLEVPAVATDTTLNAPLTEKPGATIGSYKLIEQIGEGGMGVVFMAQQAKPIKRVVAVKIIKPGMDSNAVLARFEAERQALALMDHPNIAKVLDAGSTESGRPFFVMELVKGVPITEYCDQRRLTPRERLELFLPVCKAIQHAHQKGVIHRDIKPSNVLVALYDDKPVPKVIDFGVAKATGQALTEKTLLTGFGALVGTPEYMSPEQAELNNLDIDTRSDVYSLGVLLYELLTGSTPMDRKSLGEAALLEVLRIVREVEAPRPSAKLSSSEALPSIAANRNLEPVSLTKLLEGELDWVLLKALEKDRARRYETANGLARDIERYLADEVVEARPPSTGYRMRKFVRRHKGQVIAASLVLLALLAGIGGTTFGLVRAERQRGIAQQQQQRAEAGERLADERLTQVEAEKNKVEAEKQVAQEVRDFLQDKLLGQADTRNQANALLKAGNSSAEAKFNPTVRELLDRAAVELAPDKIEASFPKQPLLQAELLETVGDTYRGIGEYQRAIEFLTRAAELRKTHLGPDHRATLAMLDRLASVYQAAGNLPRAIGLFERARDGLVKKLGADDPDTLRTFNNLAWAYQQVGKLPEAIELYERVRDAQVKKLGADHPVTLIALDNLAWAYVQVGKLPEAIKLIEQVRDAEVRKLGADHPDTLITLKNLAAAYQDAGRVPEAIKLLEHVHDAELKKLAPDHPLTLQTLNDLANAFREAGNFPQAIKLLDQVRNAQVKKLGAEHPHTLTTLNNLALAYQAVGKLREALPLYQQAAAGFEKRNYTGLNARVTILNTISAFETAKQLDKAESWRRKWLAVVKQKHGDESHDYAGELAGLGVNLLRQKKYTDAEPILRECLKLREKLLEKKQAAQWEVANVRSMLGESLMGQSKAAEAEALLVAGYEGLRRDERAIPEVARQVRVIEAIHRLIDLARAQNQPDEVKKWQAELAKYPAGKPAETPDKPVPEKQDRPEAKAATDKKPVKP